MKADVRKRAQQFLEQEEQVLSVAAVERMLRFSGFRPSSLATQEDEKSRTGYKTMTVDLKQSALEKLNQALPRGVRRFFIQNSVGRLQVFAWGYAI